MTQSIADAEKAEKEAEEAARAEREAEEERVRVEAKIKKRESFGAEPEVDSGDASSVASIAVRLPGEIYRPRPPPSLANHSHFFSDAVMPGHAPRTLLSGVRVFMSDAVCFLES